MDDKDPGTIECEDENDPALSGWMYDTILRARKLSREARENWTPPLKLFRPMRFRKGREVKKIEFFTTINSSDGRDWVFLVTNLDDTQILTKRFADGRCLKGGWPHKNDIVNEGE